MMRFSALTYGFVFRDERDKNHRACFEVDRSWYKAIGRGVDEVRALHVSTKAPRTWRRDEAKHLIAASSEPVADFDLSVYIGQRVKVELAHGKVSGVVFGFEYTGVECSVGPLPFPIRVPVAINLDGEVWPFGELRSIDLIE